MELVIYIYIVFCSSFLSKDHIWPGQRNRRWYCFCLISHGLEQCHSWPAVSGTAVVSGPGHNKPWDSAAPWLILNEHSVAEIPLSTLDSTVYLNKEQRFNSSGKRRFFSFPRPRRVPCLSLQKCPRLEILAKGNVFVKSQWLRSL